MQLLRLTINNFNENRMKFRFDITCIFKLSNSNWRYFWVSNKIKKNRINSIVNMDIRFFRQVTSYLTPLSIRAREIHSRWKESWMKTMGREKKRPCYFQRQGCAYGSVHAIITILGSLYRVASCEIRYQPRGFASSCSIR